MPDLLQSLQSRDLGHLRIVAELCGLELSSTKAEAARQELTNALLQPETLAEILESLPEAAHHALTFLLQNGGKVPWPVFSRRFGEIRAVGPARRDREKLYLHPISPAEILFYRALLGCTFFDTPTGPQEFAYLPDDLAGRIRALIHPPPAGDDLPPLGRAATPEERAYVLPPFDYLLDDATTLLAALRMGMTTPPTAASVDFVLALLRAARLLHGNDPQPEAIRAFLKASRSQALEMLHQAWEQSEDCNELRLLPGLICEGEWKNDPRQARLSILHLLRRIPQGQWWSLSAFRHAVKETCPDFQRPAGDYDSWFIRRAADGVYLRGFEHWDEVDGALIDYLITGPLFWLKIVTLAAPTRESAPTAFKLLPEDRRASAEEDARLHVSSRGVIVVPRPVPRAARYQIARFCEWRKAGPEEYRYQVTAASLQRARSQGLKANHLLTLLARHASAELPPALIKAIQRWEKRGCEVRLEHLTVLRVSAPEILQELRRSKAGRFLAEPLGPTTIAVKSGAQTPLVDALIELGWLTETPEND